MSNSNDLVVVFAGDTFQASHVKNVLENSNIHAFLKDEFTGTIAPWHSSPGGAGAVKVSVPERDREKALLIIQQFLDNETA